MSTFGSMVAEVNCLRRQEKLFQKLRKIFVDSPILGAVGIILIGVTLCGLEIYTYIKTKRFFMPLLMTGLLGIGLGIYILILFLFRKK